MQIPFYWARREIFLIWLIAFLPILVFGFFSIKSSLDEGKRLARQVDEILIENFAEEVLAFLDRAHDSLQSITALSLERIDREILRAIYENNKFHLMYIFESLLLTDEKGKVLMSYPLKKELIGLDYSRQPFFISVSKEKSPFFSQVEFSLLTEQPIVAIAFPLFGKKPEGKLEGVLVGTVRLQAFSELLKQFSDFRKTGIAFIIDPFGNIIAHPDYKLVKERENINNLQPQLAQMLLKASGKKAFSFLDPKGIEYLVTVREIPLKWKIIFMEDSQEVFSHAMKLRNFLLMALFFVFCGAGLIGQGIAFYIAKLESEREKRLEELEKLREKEIVLRIREMAKAKDIQKKIEELEKFHKLAVGRELKMIELKKEVKKLREKLERFKTKGER